jgi:N-acetylmuramoyl-L-alanine amidase
MYPRLVLSLFTTLLGTAGPRPDVQPDFVIVVDPGHGGSNGGCVGFDGRVREKDVSLQMALELRAALARRLPHAEVALTREGDVTVPLVERVAIANGLGADLFISLHANASERRDQQGFETYVLDARASSLDAAWTARRENLVAVAPELPQSDAHVMVDELALAGRRQQAIEAAARIQREQAARFPDRSDRGVKQAPFDVLRGAKMPAVLFEVGFLDHQDEGQRIMTQEFRQRIIDGLVEAIVVHYRERARSRVPVRT